MRVAITGATGKLGSAVVAATTACIGSENVVALARTPAKAQHLGVEVRPGDYDQRDELEKSLVGVDRVLLISGMDPPEQRIAQHRNVIEAARSSGVQKIVYTSVQGPASDTAFSPIVRSNRRTEEDVKASGLEWVIGRNGIYIEPDVEYAPTYVERGEIANCAGAGRCGYTTRSELGFAYASLLTDSLNDGKTLKLHGEPISQLELAEHLGFAFDADLVYRAMSFEEYHDERVAELGEFIGSVIAGIYQGIHAGAFDATSDFQTATGRPHQSWGDYFTAVKAARP